MRGEKLSKFEGWLMVVMVIIVFGGMVWGYWSISPLVLLAAIGVLIYPLWVYPHTLTARHYTLRQGENEQPRIKKTGDSQ